MRAINLLPKQAVKDRSAGLGGKLPLIGSAAVPVIAVILVIVGHSSGSSALTAKKAQLATVNAQVAAAARAAAPDVSITTAAPNTTGLVAQRTQRLAALQSVLVNEVAWDTTLRDVARVLPENVWLTSLTVISPTPADVVVTAPVVTTPTDGSAGASGDAATPPPAPAPAPSVAGFTINGTTYTQEDVAAMLQRLAVLPTLTNVTLLSTTRALIGARAVVQFNVSASLKPATAATQP